MELQMFSMGNLKTMEVIDINSGGKIGYIKDFKIDCEAFKIVSIIIPSLKLTWFNKNNFIEIPWDRVTKVGVDVILVDGADFVLSDEHQDFNK